MPERTEPTRSPQPTSKEPEAVSSPPLLAVEGTDTLGAGPGRLIASPSPNAIPDAEIDPEGNDTEEKRRAERQLLTGRAARLAGPAPSPLALAWRRLRKNRLAVTGGLLLIALYGIALFAPFLAPYGYSSQSPNVFQPPMRIHWLPSPSVYAITQGFDEFRDRIYTEDTSRPEPLHFFVRGESYRLFGVFPTDLHLFGILGDQRCNLLGTDRFGRDCLSRMLYGSQISLSAGLIGIVITFALGLLVGGISGFYGGRIDNVIMRGCEIILSVPDFYLLLALAATLPPTLPPAEVYLLIIMILSFVGWAGTARVVRGIVLSVRELQYVEAARALGVSDFRIILRHVLPSTFTFAIVAASLSIPGYILAESGLSFLGLGIRDPMPSLGNMLSDAQDLTSLEHRGWLLIPGLIIMTATLAFNFLGDGLRDALDPKSR